MTSSVLRGLKEDAGDYLLDSRTPQNQPAQLLVRSIDHRSLKQGGSMAERDGFSLCVKFYTK